MHRSEVSVHLARIFTYVSEAKSWVTNMDIVEGTDVKAPTVRMYTKYLVDAGIFDIAEVWPGHRYRISPEAEKRNKGYILRLQQAQDIFGLRKK